MQRFYRIAPICLQNIVISLAGYSIHRQRSGKAFGRTISLLSQSSKWTPAEVHTYQRNKLHSLLLHAFSTVPYYRELWTSIGFRPEGFQAIDQISELPLLEKEDVFLAGQRLVSQNYRPKDLSAQHTSGSTGKPLTVYWSKEVPSQEAAFLWARLRRNVKPNDKVASFNGREIVPLSQKKPPFWRVNAFGRQTLFSVYHMNDRNLGSYVNELIRGRYGYLQGYPSAIATLSEYMLINGLSLQYSPQAIFTSSETLSTQQRLQIEQAFNTRVTDLYGSVERVVMIAQCEYGNYHPIPEYGITEFIPVDESDEEVIAEIVATGFINDAMPLIRYKMKDLVTIQKRSACPCGGWPVIKSIDGRVEDAIITPEGNRVGRLAHVFCVQSIKESQIVQESLNSICVHYVPRPEFRPEDLEQFERLLRNKVGSSITVRFQRESELQRTKNGKLRAVISLVK